MKEIKSPLRYPGGKSRMVKTLWKYIPDFDEYREPFVGGGSVFAYIKQRYPKKKYWINDLYEDLYIFYNELKNQSNIICKEIRSAKEYYTDGKKLFNKCKDVLMNEVPIVKSIFFFILNRISFSGTAMSGGFSQSAFKDRFTDSSIDRLEGFAPLLKKVKITNLDYEELINADGKNVFLFLDPPYESAEKSKLYGNKGDMHKGFDHERLAETLKQCKHKWLMTYNDSEYIRNLYSFAKIIPVECTYGMKNVSENKQKGNKEILIMNYEII